MSLRRSRWSGRRCLSVRDAGDDARSRSLSRPRAHRPHRIRARSRSNRQIKALSRDGRVVERAPRRPSCSRSAVSRACRSSAPKPATSSPLRASKRRPSPTRSATSPSKRALPANPIDPPTLAITVSVNDSPLAGREGEKVQSRVIRDRLLARGRRQCRDQRAAKRDEASLRGRRPRRAATRRADRDHAPRRLRARDQPPARAVSRRGRPAQRLEPIEEVTIDVDEAYAGIVIEKISHAQRRHARTCARPARGKTRLVFYAPSRGLIGYHGEFLTDTRGTGVMNRMFHGYAPHKGAIEGRAQRRAGLRPARATPVAYALWYLEERGSCSSSPARASIRA